MRWFKDFDLGTFNVRLSCPVFMIGEMTDIRCMTGISIFISKNDYREIKISLLGFSIEITIWVEDLS